MTTNALTGVCSGEAGHADTITNQTFGFWLYIMSDLVLFGTLFATYAVLGHNYAGGPTGKDLFHLREVFIETVLLLVSSANRPVQNSAADRPTM